MLIQWSHRDLADVRCREELGLRLCWHSIVVNVEFVAVGSTLSIDIYGLSFMFL